MAHAGYEQLTLGLFDTASAYSSEPRQPPSQKCCSTPHPSPSRLPPAPFRSPGGSPASAPWPRAGAAGAARSGRDPAAAADRGGGSPGHRRGAGGARPLCRLRRRRARGQFVPPPGQGLPPRLARARQSSGQLVTPAELAALARSTQYAHYTPEPGDPAIWAALLRLGFSGGRVLEPGRSRSPASCCSDRPPLPPNHGTLLMAAA